MSSSGDPESCRAAGPHVIRLAGPWEFLPLARTVLLPDGSTQAESGELPPGGKVQPPADWGATLGADFRGRVRYRRRFGRPSGLAHNDRVDLVIDRVDAWARVTLNDAPLGEITAAQSCARYDVTARLEPRNELSVEVELPRQTPQSAPLPRGDRVGLPGGLVGEVRLEIHAGAA